MKAIPLSSTFSEKITVQLHPDYHCGDEFVIRVTGNPGETSYMHSVALNG